MVYSDHVVSYDSAWSLMRHTSAKGETFLPHSFFKKLKLKQFMLEYCAFSSDRLLPA